MGRLLLRTLLPLALIMVALPASASQLWQDAEVGISPETVRGLYPGAEESNGNERGVHGVPALVLKGYKVSDRDFNVEFYFEDDALYKVILRLQEPQLGTKELPNIYRDLLTSRYGEPLSYYTEPDPLPLIKATWLDDRRDITLYWTLIRGERPSLSIIYSTRIADGAEKL